MNGEQLHAIAPDVESWPQFGHRRLGFVGTIEPALFDGGGVEVVEERGDADVIAAGGELGGDVDQAIEIGAGRRSGRRRARAPRRRDRSCATTSATRSGNGCPSLDRSDAQLEANLNIRA